MALRFPDRLESNNPNAYGIVKANLVSGHKSVKAITDLYTLADAILSDSGNGSDAIGQRWFVIDDNHYYELVNWANRKQASGWSKIDIQVKLDTKVDKVAGKSLVEDTEITKLKGLPNKDTLNSQIATAKQAGDTAQANLTTHIGNTSNPHNVTKALLKIENVDNTSDLDKPISTATQTALNKKVDKVDNKSLVADSEITKLSQLPNKATLDSSIADAKKAGTDAQTALANKVDKVQGKLLSTNDYTTAEKEKLVSLKNYDDTVVKQDIAKKMNIAAKELVSDDLNSILEYGFYYGGGDNTVVNKPTGVDAFGLHVYQTANGFKVQELTEGNINPGAIYWRQNNLSGWSPWIPKAGVFLNDIVEGQLLSADTKGRLKNTGFTIATSVPANAKFTDTTYTDATLAKSGLMSAADKKLVDSMVGVGKWATI